MYCALQKNVRLPLRAPPEHVIPAQCPPVVEESRGVPGNGDAASDGPMPQVLLDLWHAKRRLLDVACSTHGAYLAFCEGLTNAFTILDPRAMADLKAAVIWLNPTVEPWEVHQFLRKKYDGVLKHVPRVIPPPGILVERYDAVIKLSGVFRTSSHVSRARLSLHG